LNKETRFISDILFDKEINLELFPKKNNHKFWDKFVKIASSHYVIPALYFKLKERNFLELLNSELVSYLEEIYNQNLNRNTELVKEVNEISHLLKTHSINHVFLKGSALVSSIYKESVGVRMVGDIDILIAKDQIQKAKNLLELGSYSYLTPPFEPFFKLKSKHLNRLVNKKKIFAIELHSKISDKNVKHENFLDSKKMVNYSFVPKTSNLLFHSIINFQLNDFGSLRATFHFRTLFDVFNLSKPDLIHKTYDSTHFEKIKVVMKNLNIIRFKTPFKLFFFESRFKLINSFYIFSLFNKTLIDVFLFLSLSPVIRVKQIIALINRKDYRTFALKKIRIIK
jgi:hypothetical protein